MGSHEVRRPLRLLLAVGAGLAGVTASMASAAPPDGGVQPPPVTLPVTAPAQLPAGNMAYYGGPVMTRPRAYLVLWGWRDRKDPTADYMRRFLAGVGGSRWLGSTTQYTATVDGRTVHVGNQPDQLVAVWRDPRGPGKAVLADNASEVEARRAAAHFGVVGDHNAMVIVAWPSYSAPRGFADGEYCAYHSSTLGTPYVNLPYLVDTAGCGANYVNDGPRGAYDGVSMVLGHEYAEVMTDPLPFTDTAWHDVNWGENADKCSWIYVGPYAALNVTFRTGRFAVQQLWSNEDMEGAGACTAG